MLDPARARRGLVSTLVLASILALGPESGLASTEDTGTLRGRVTDAAGAPVADMEVVLEGPAGARRTARTDAEGSVVFEGLAAGRWTLAVALANSRNRTEESVLLEAGAHATVELRLTWLLQDSVTVSGSVTRELTRVPGGTALLSREELDGTRRHNMQEVLRLVPGVLASSRWGADETQLSVRGSGLRNNFHHRGLNLLINGMVFQDADGFGDFETLDLMAIERVEVWKGANALRYGGNTLGGAINFVTYSGQTGEPLEVAWTGGSFGLLKGQIASAGKVGGASYYVSASRTELDGFREHSGQERTRVFGNLRWQVSEELEVWTDTLYADVHEKLPGALTRREFESAPRRAEPTNVAQDHGRFYDYGRLGVGLRRRFGDRHSLEATLFGQVRDVLHPIFQVLDQDQRTYGAELRYAYEGAGDARLRRLVVGLAPLVGRNDERRFDNRGGVAGERLGEFGADTDNLGLYLETEVGLSEALTLLLGGRWDRSERRFEDRFTADGDRSDRRSFEAFAPKLGVLWQGRGSVEVFANLSRAYEPPLILELASFGAPGFLDLEAQDAWQAEIGTRGRVPSGLSWEVSLYDAEIDEEIVNENVRPFPGAPFTVPSFRNAERTRHRGLEVGLAAPLGRSLLTGGDRLSGQLAYTWSDFTFVDGPVFGDNELPGAPEHLVRGELRYEHPGGAWVAPGVDWSPAAYFLDSANTVANDPYLALSLRGGLDWRELGIFAEARNLTGERYSPSAQVDAADGRFFEPAPGLSLSLGVRWRR